MHYFFEDLLGVTAASLLSVLLVIVPGFGIASLLARFGVLGDDATRRSCWGVLLGAVLLPAVDALLVRWVGFFAVLLLHMALWGPGVRLAVQAVWRIPVRWWSAIGACWIAVAWANVDVDWNGRLYQPLFIIDGVKHAAVVAALARYGVPLHDPFFSRPGAAGYYYYFYIAPALVHWLAGFLIDSRAAFAGATFVTLISFPSMLFLVGDAAALIPDGQRRRFLNATLLLSCVSGLDLIPGLWIWAQTGYLLPQLDWWSEEVRWALTSILNVPHHITAVIAVYSGCLLIAGEGHRRPVLRSAVAALAFATAFGCSLWVSVAAFAVLCAWWVCERIRGQGWVWALPLSGLGAFLISLPQMVDISAGRSVTSAPLLLYVRPVGPLRTVPHSLPEWIVHLAVIPGGYLIEFGIFALGACAFLTRGRLSASRNTAIGRLLLVAAPVTLILVTFVRSAVIYNDFGWRAIWEAQVPAMLWTASMLSRDGEQLRKSGWWSVTFALGLAGLSWDFAGMRLLRPYAGTEWVNEHPQVDFDLRGAYRWIDATLAPDVIVQHNPRIAPRLFDFGLYSDRPVAVADRDAQLFGASPVDVAGRISLLAPIFDHPMTALELRRRSAVAGVGGILLTSDDPLWRVSGGPPRNWECRYRSSHSCVMIVEKLQ